MFNSNVLLFMSHSNHHWKVATRYLMFAALGSILDKEQNKLIKITVHCTVTVLSLSVMPTCHDLHSFPPLLPCPLSLLQLMCYSPFSSPLACTAQGSSGIRTCWSKSSWGSPRWSRGWSPWWVQELGLFSRAKKRLQAPLPSCYAKNLFSFYFDGSIQTKD